MSIVSRTSLFRISLAIAAAVLPVSAAAGSFSDVGEDHPAFSAIEYLKEKGILQGYSDGTFKPNQLVNRAEGLKIIVAQLVSAEDIEAAKGISKYTDVDAGAWYAPFIEKARASLGIIDGPPKTQSFAATRPVNKVEFLKMLLLGNKIDPAASYGEITIPLDPATNSDQWFYPYVRYGLSASMLTVKPDGSLDPASSLTRGDVALMMYRLLMYRDGRRTQALLSLSETEILNILQSLENQDVEQAEYASGRSLLAARGALATSSDEPLVKAAVKTSEGFRELVLSYKAGKEGRLDDAIAHAGTAWHLADVARGFSPGLNEVATQMQTISKNMADEARRLKAQ